LLLTVIGLFFSAGVSIPVNSSVTQRANKIKIGALGPLAITPGKDMEAGAKLAVKEINEGAGVTVGATTYDIELIIETTSHATTGLPDAATGGISLTKLLDNDDVTAVIGGFRTEVVLQLQSILDRPMLGVGSTAPIITPYFWRLGPSNGSGLTRTLIDFYGFGLASVKGVQNVTIVREDAAWSLAMSSGLHFYLNNYLPGNAVTPRINFTKDIVISPLATLDSVVSSLTPLSAPMPSLESNIDLNVNAIMHIFSGPVGAKIPKAWSSLDLPQWLAGINVESQSSTSFMESAGANYGEIQMETAPPDVEQTNKTAAFRAAYAAEYGEQPTYTAFASYDSIMVLADAMNRAGALDAASIQTALGNTHWTGTAYEIAWTSEDNVWDHPLFGYPYGQVGYNLDGSRHTLIANEDLIVHDLYTTGTVGVRGQPWIQGYMAQWQYGGVKKTVWSKGPTVVDDIGNLTSRLGNDTAPFDHTPTGSGYVEETTTPTTTTDGTTTPTTTAETTTTTTTVTDIPGFGFPFATFILIALGVVFTRRKKR
jgi:ABC-type branched-subunit amino acid transport system substrate-binding protein